MKDDERLMQAVQALANQYERALKINEKNPGTIRDPVSWALYRAWRQTDGEKKQH